jgi:CubicO group peptidase (beta-lactamase class C family)
MAKSITSLLIGAAIKEGKIKSVDETVANYLPGFKDGMAAELKIKDLLTMSSGSNWDESYANPLSVTTESYYGTDLYKTATGLRSLRSPVLITAINPGTQNCWDCCSKKRQGLAWVLMHRKSYGNLWALNQPALWSTDKEKGNEKAFCCFNSNAGDFARIGQLMLDSGKWKGNTIIDSAYYVQSINGCNIPDEEGLPCNYYGYQWWIRPAYPVYSLPGAFRTIYYCYSIKKDSTCPVRAQKVG